jgi:hypothetical protein
MSENIKLKSGPKKRKRRRKSVWNEILEKEYQLSELNLFSETLNANMTTEAFLLEKKRRPRDYIA